MYYSLLTNIVNMLSQQQQLIESNKNLIKN